MELVYFLLLAISSLAMSVRALKCYTNDTSSSKYCVAGTTYCYLASLTEDLQSYVQANCDNFLIVCTGEGCKYDSVNSLYVYCCSTEDCNYKGGRTCAQTTTTTSTSAPITTTTTTGKPSASSKLLPSGFLVFCLTIFPLLLVNALF